MLISIDWIKDFTKIPEDLTPKELGEKFTLATAEVEDVIVIGDHLEKITVVEVTLKEKHPEADKLNLVTFTNGSESFQVVCGAANVEVGMKVPYAPLGITLPNGLTLEPKKIRGILSEGMLCSEEELGFSQESEGLLEIDKQAKLGMSMLELFNETKDVLLDVDNKSLTHRPDLWGHFGLAREFATVFGSTLTNRFTADWTKGLKDKFTSEMSPIKISVDQDSSSLGYFGLSIDGVKIVPSPTWMIKRLNAVGLKPINNIVDISNYVMLELGIPLHIFDRSQISGDTVSIKRIGQETTFKTLDEQERILIASDTVISDKNGPLVLAGIMGGLTSSVSDTTDKVFIEVANWKASQVRQTSTRLGLRTDSSTRYEKTLDSQLLERTLLRTLELILELCPEAKVIGKAEYDGLDLSTIKTLKIKSSTQSICNKIGKDISFDEMKKIFNSLDFEIVGDANSFEAIIPTYRATKDVETESCLVEEIGRIVGFDNIEPISPMLDIAPIKLGPAQSLHRKIRDFMMYHGHALEVMTYPMIGESLLKKAMWKIDRGLELHNALSKDAELMRTSMVPSLLEAVSKNAKNYDEYKFFEIGRTYHADDKTFSNEKSKVAIVHYSKSETPFMNVVNDSMRMLDSISVNYQLSQKHPKFKNNLIDEDWNGVHPYEFYNIRIQGKMDGVIFSVHPIVLKSFKVKGHVSICIVDMTSFEARAIKGKVKYLPLPKFPGSTFDCTVVTDLETPVSYVLDGLKKLKIKELQSTKVVDTFILEDGKKSVTLRSHFLDREKTLKGDFITDSSNKIVEALDKAGFSLKS